ncbi:DoxX family protein [Larkinella sp. VNQ87]|uniref:DoxX family protein n=1 Tax=Larkinella sp. VNQ87 TaxID=3400921 RepID=UPI003C0A5925
MKTTKILYWVFTGLFAFFMFGSAIPNILVDPMSVQGFKDMGYPVYLIPFLGWAKLLGVIAILVPGFPRIKEWAYAGLMYDILGAIYSISMLDKLAVEWVPMLIIPTIGLASYVYYHKWLKAKSDHLADAPSGSLKVAG